MERPLVSICCITYNHEPYIRECLEGFLMQKTNFPIEILIHDDASTDHTADIIREYEAKYPDIIKPIYQTVNQYSQGIPISVTYNFPRAQGKYIALCEGDDFWCDPEKLQKQVDFLETHPNYSACFCGLYIYNEFDCKISPMGMPKEEFPTNKNTALERILLGFTPFQTCAILFRNDSMHAILNEYMEDIKNAPMGDLQLFFHLARTGSLNFISRRMVCYRRHSNSASCYNSEKQQQFLEECRKYILLIAKKYGFGYLIPQVKPYVIHKGLLISMRKQLRKLKVVIRGDKRLFSRCEKLAPKEKILLINSFFTK